MKKLAKICLLSGLSLSMAACSTSSNSDLDPMATYGCDTLNVFNWGEYIGDDVNAGFEDLTGAKVVYSLFGSNEEMYSKIMASSDYDIIIPSDYMAELLISEGAVQELDLSKIPNTSLLHEGVMEPVFDPDFTYSIPYFWGNVGIVYDTTVIDQADVEAQGYSVFLNEKYADEDVVVYDSERDAFMMAFKALGYSMNTEDPEEIQAAYDWLLQVNDVMSPAYLQDEVIDGMITGQYVMANVYSGDAAYMLYENEDLAFWAPTEGTNIWIDSMLIPADSKCSDLAHEYMNYILSYDAAYSNSSYVGYSSPNAEVLEELSSEGGDYYENVAYLPRVGYEYDEFFRHNEVLKKELADLWIRIKTQ